MIRVAFVTLFTIIAVQNAAATGYVVGRPCNRLFVDATGDFIAAMAVLAETNILTEIHFKRVLEGLETTNEVINPITEQEALLSSSFIHRRGFEEFLKHESVDKEKLKAWLREQIRSRERIQTQRSDIRSETLTTYRAMDFVRVEKGEFTETQIENVEVEKKYLMFFKKTLHGQKTRTIKHTIEQDFELMSTHVTQFQWAIVMATNPSTRSSGPTQTIEVNGKLIKIHPNHPAEGMSWDEAQIFVSRVNELSRKNDPLIYKIIPNHPKYSTYRLPYEIEMQYVFHSFGEGAGLRDYVPSLEEFSKHEWHVGNSGGVTHPVGELKPYEIKGKAFYDLVGNVGQFMQDVLPDSVRLSLGGYWGETELYRTLPLHGQNHRAQKIYSNQNTGHIGIRLVRAR